MAPVLPFGRARAMELLEQGKLPFSFGSPHPKVVVVEQDGRFRIRALVIDPDRARAASEAALARGENWMPEHHYALAEPVGTIFAEASTAAGLLELMRAMPWPSDW